MEGAAYFVDPDCYSRMSRVEQVVAAPWRAIRFHDFENAPVGVLPHTTAPTDFLIAALAVFFDLGSRLGYDSPIEPLELAGAFLSPLLSLTLDCFSLVVGPQASSPLSKRDADHCGHFAHSRARLPVGASGPPIACYPHRGSCPGDGDHILEAAFASLGNGRRRALGAGALDLVV